jgi:predicted DNA-binding antitoxin AbrB/MazE fold protein
MGGKEITCRGVFRNGVIVPDQPLPLPDGTHVTVTVHPIATESKPEVEQLSEEAVREVDQWERQE